MTEHILYGLCSSWGLPWICLSFSSVQEPVWLQRSLLLSLQSNVSPSENFIPQASHPVALFNWGNPRFAEILWENFISLCFRAHMYDATVTERLQFPPGNLFLKNVQLSKKYLFKTGTWHINSMPRSPSFPCKNVSVCVWWIYLWPLSAAAFCHIFELWFHKLDTRSVWEISF